MSPPAESLLGTSVVHTLPRKTDGRSGSNDKTTCLHGTTMAIKMTSVKYKTVKIEKYRLKVNGDNHTMLTLSKGKQEYPSEFQTVRPQRNNRCRE